MSKGLQVKRSTSQKVPISAMLKVPDGTFSWKWFKSLAQRSDINLVGSTGSWRLFYNCLLEDFLFRQGRYTKNVKA